LAENHFPVETEINVRFSDADAMGHVNNACYLTYFEQARVAYFKKLHGGDLSRMEPTESFNFIIGEITVRFQAPAFIDEMLIVGVRVAEFGTKSFRMEYEIRRKKTDEPVATGQSTQVMYDYKTKKTFPIPDSFREKMMALEKKS
jgi:acyl-CoA thioester hydrolase